MSLGGACLPAVGRINSTTVSSRKERKSGRVLSRVVFAIVVSLGFLNRAAL